MPMAPNPCDECLAAACCSAVVECWHNFACFNEQSCFDSCYAPGQGIACEAKCYEGSPSVAGQNLLSCALSNCLSACQ
jgi:hypothetical protein